MIFVESDNQKAILKGFHMSSWYQNKKRVWWFWTNIKPKGSLVSWEEGSGMISVEFDDYNRLHERHGFTHGVHVA